MVRGNCRNWQHKVERVEARKTAAKQLKQRAEEKRLCKVWFRDLLNQLDRYEEAVRSSSTTPTLHIWSDMIPSSSEPLLDLLEEEDIKIATTAGAGGKLRKGGEKGAGPIASPSNERGKKKVHPRSKEATTSYAEDDFAESSKQLLLCRSSFLKDKCDYKGKKFGCKYLHYNHAFQTLGAVLGTAELSSSSSPCCLDSDQLSKIESSLVEATPAEMVENNPGAMEFLYHIRIQLPLSNDDTIANFVMERLSELQTPISSVFYVVLNKNLVFDKLRGGMLLDEREFYSSIADIRTPLNRRSSSIGSECSEESLDGISNSTVLEHILLYLPDQSVAAATQVCKSWYNEIGQHSPSLWRQLLERRGWPVPPETEDGQADRDTCRSTYMEHYSTVRNLRALSSAASAIADNQTVQQDSPEFAYQDFFRRKNPPGPYDQCVSIHVWSDRLILVGYAVECSLRLFEASVPEDVGELRCKELICHAVSPYQNTKKRKCLLQAVDMDEHNIGCLCRVSSDQTRVTADILVVIPRDEFLLGESSEASSKKASQENSNKSVIDIGESLLDYLLSSDVVDHRLLPLFDFLNVGGKIEEVVVEVSTATLRSCGFGRFAIEVSIQIPTEGFDFDEEREGDNGMRQLDRKLVIFSSSLGAIVWAGESYPPHLQPFPAEETVNLASSRQGSACTIASRSTRSSDILLTEIKSNGSVQPPLYLEASTLARAVISDGNFSFAEQRGLVLTHSDVVALDVLVNMIDREPDEVRSFITFFPLYPDANQPMYEILRLPPRYLVETLRLVGQKYIVALCSIFKQRESGEADNLGGQRVFGSERAPNIPPGTIAVVVCIKSRSIVDNVHFPSQEKLDFVGLDDGNTAALAISARGVCITGHSVRSARTSRKHEIGCSISPSQKKKKRSSKRKQGSKKDGFARGISLRG